MKRKILCLFSVTVFVVAFAACAKKAEEVPQDEVIPQSKNQQMVEQIEDREKSDSTVDDKQTENETAEVDTEAVESNYLVDLCPAYEFDKYEYAEYTSSNGKTFMMGGKKYSNGFCGSAKLDGNDDVSTALFNLEGKYSRMTFIAGAVDNQMTDNGELRIFADNKLVKSVEIIKGALPSEYSVELNNAQQLRIDFVSSRVYYNVGKIGVAEVILE